ncbi:MAG: energy-coupling factor ABC transporter ATP-binding protein [Treponema sp.]|jgi:biotin transport system ATP-binding protein|nr:energy-coupling factor ABC transporter ATP-binding protein [Treponema sp.]
MKNNAITLENITKRFPVYDEHLTANRQAHGGFFYALEDVSLVIKSGMCVIIAGANGSGKSLLMSIIAGLEEPTSGTVNVAGKTGLVFQEPDAQILGETVREDTAFGPANSGISKKEIKALVDSALEQTGLSGREEFPARSLSGGEKRRLAAAGVLAMNADIIIFDEPYANLDYPGIVQVNGLFKKLIAGEKTLLILTHELEKCLSLADQFIVLFQGKKVFDGTAAQALSLNLEEWGIHHPLSNCACELGALLW